MSLLNRPVVVILSGLSLIVQSAVAEPPKRGNPPGGGGGSGKPNSSDDNRRRPPAAPRANPATPPAGAKPPTSTRPNQPAQPDDRRRGPGNPTRKPNPPTTSPDPRRGNPGTPPAGPRPGDRRGPGQPTPPNPSSNAPGRDNDRRRTPGPNPPVATPDPRRGNPPVVVHRPPAGHHRVTNGAGRPVVIRKSPWVIEAENRSRNHVDFMRRDPVCSDRISNIRRIYVGTHYTAASYQARTRHYFDHWSSWHNRWNTGCGSYYRHGFYGGFYYPFYECRVHDYFHYPLVNWMWVSTWDDGLWVSWYGVGYRVRPFRYAGWYYPTVVMKDVAVTYSSYSVTKQSLFRDAMEYMTLRLEQKVSEVEQRAVSLGENDIVISHSEILAGGDALVLEGTVNVGDYSLAFKAVLDLVNPASTIVFLPGSQAAMARANAPASVDFTPAEVTEVELLNAKIAAAGGDPLAAPVISAEETAADDLDATDGDDDTDSTVVVPPPATESPPVGEDPPGQEPGSPADEPAPPVVEAPPTPNRGRPIVIAGPNTMPGEIHLEQNVKHLDVDCKFANGQTYRITHLKVDHKDGSPTARVEIKRETTKFWDNKATYDVPQQALAKFPIHFAFSRLGIPFIGDGAFAKFMDEAVAPASVNAKDNWRILSCEERF